MDGPRGASGGGGFATRALRLFLLLLLAFAAVEYLLYYMLHAVPLRTHLYTLKAVKANIGNKSPVSWPKPSPKDNPETKDNKLHTKNTTLLINKFNTINLNITDEMAEETTTVIGDKVTRNVTIPGRPACNDTPLFISRITKGVKSLVTTKQVVWTRESPLLPMCAQMPPDLGPISVNKSKLKLDFVETKFPEIQWGGRYAPPNCTARHKVAIIVPYRDRPQRPIFLNHMHPFLMKQQLEYGIFIVEQQG